MPSFTAQLPNLQASGPLVDLRVWIGTPVEEALRKSGMSPPDPVPVKAMIDTGATGSVIQPEVAKRLGLQPVGVATISTASSENVPCYQYAVRLVFPNNVIVEAIVIEAPLKGQRIQCLVGRDVLAHGVLIYTGLSSIHNAEGECEDSRWENDTKKWLDPSAVKSPEHWLITCWGVDPVLEAIAMKKREKPLTKHHLPSPLGLPFPQGSCKEV